MKKAKIACFVVLFAVIILFLCAAAISIPAAPPKPSYNLDSRGNLKLSSHCSNGVQDSDEQGKDCGGSCLPCSKFKLWYILALPFAVVFASVVVHFFLKRKGSAPQQQMQSPQYAQQSQQQTQLNPQLAQQQNQQRILQQQMLQRQQYYQRMQQERQRVQTQPQQNNKN